VHYNNTLCFGDNELVVNAAIPNSKLYKHGMPPHKEVIAVGCLYPMFVEIYIVDKDQYTKRSELSVGACYLVY